jgi:PST family polysaccharide transporter
LLYPKEVVGLYYFAFAMSLHTVMLFCSNLWTLLFPAFCKLKHEPERQLAGFLRAVRLIALIVTPACMLQAALSEPGIRLFFPERWVPAIPILQILSIGMAARAIDWTSEALLLSQGRFQAYLRVVSAHAAIFGVLVGFGAWHGEAVGAAIGVACCLWIIGPIKTWMAIGPLGGKWVDSLRIFGMPLLASAIAVGPVVLATYMIPAIAGQDAARFVIIVVVSASLYSLAARRLMPDRWAEAMQALRQLVNRQRAGVRQ